MGTRSSITESGAPPREGSPHTLAATLVLGLAAVAVAGGWACWSRRLPCRRYAGTGRGAGPWPACVGWE